MKIVVIGGTGRIGRRLVRRLEQMGAEPVAASPTVGVDAVTGVGLEQALNGAEVLVDVSNSPSLEGAAALHFFETAGRNLQAAAREAGVRHHVMLSIVGVDRLEEHQYFQAKKRQEELVRSSGLPFTILRSTQFFEFIGAVVQEGTERKIAISPALAQPVASGDVAATLAELALGEPLNATIELAGPEPLALDYVATEIATASKTAAGSLPTSMPAISAPSFEEGSLLPGPNARIGSLRLDDWVRDCLKVPSPVADPASPW